MVAETSGRVPGEDELRGVPGARRRSRVRLPGLEHRAPIPAGVSIGELVVSSAIIGKEPDGAIVSDPRKQLRQAFVNLEAFLVAADLVREDVAIVHVYLSDLVHRDALDESWCAFFPDPDQRPCRHIVLAELDRFHEPLCAQLLVTGYRVRQ